MGLFKDFDEFKEDFSQAVNELVPGGDVPQKEESTDSLVVDTIGEEVDVQSELNKLDGLLEQVKKESDSTIEELKPLNDNNEQEKIDTPILEDAPIEKEETKMSDISMNSTTTNSNTFTQNKSTNVADETSVITASTVLTGNLESSGSFDIQGTINGNVSCNGKLVVTGTINGNSNSSEFFADVAKIEGEVSCSGTVKIGAGSVIIGNITASSAVIAGAIKGDIDVQGPVVVDTSAVIMGNIKSRSVQINNGAVIEGFCSQCYADIDVQGLFESR